MLWVEPPSSFLLRWAEVENYQTKTGQTSISLLIENFPDAAEVALNQCVHHSPHLNTTDPEYTVTHDFKYLDRGPEVKDCRKRFSTVKTMIKHQRVRLLLHPLTLKFNERKWSTLGKLGFFGDFVIYFTLLIFLSLLVFRLREDIDPPEKTNIYYDHENNVTLIVYDRNSVFMNFVPIICLLFLILQVCKEFFQIYMQRWRYFKDTSIYLRWIFYLSITVTMDIWIEFVSQEDKLIFWAVAIFVCYGNMILFLRRYRLFGTYISMYTEVIKTVIQVMVVFLFLILGFALVFYILFKDLVSVMVNVL